MVQGMLARVWRRAPSVTVKFLALLAPAVAVTTVAFCGIYYYQKYAVKHRILVEALGQATEAHAAIVASGMWSLDEPAIRTALRALAAVDSVVCVEASDELLSRRYAAPSNGDCAEAAGRVSRPAMIGGQRVGEVAVRYSDADLRAAIKADLASAVALAVLVLLGAVAAALAAHRVAVGAPLRRFLDDIARAERGHAAGTATAEASDEMGADEGGADEMGKVIDAYNRLLNRLAEDEAALAAERNLLQTTLDNIDQGVLMVDAGLRLVMHNRRAAALLGVTEGFLAGRPPFADLVAAQEKAGAFADSLADFDLRPDGAAQALARPLSFKRRLADGSVLEVRSRPLAGGGFVRTLTDVTAETSAAEDMVKAMEKLESAYRELKDTQDSLIQAEKMASLAMLVTGVAHEINTPVGIALGCAGHLSAKTRELADALGGRAVRRSLLQDYAAQAEESSRLIQQNLARAAALIQSFKAVAVDHTSQERRVFDLAAYLGEVVASLAPRAREAGARVAVACPPGLTLDSHPGALAQIIANLTVNALIHAFDGRPGGMVRLTAAQDAEDADWVRIVCADDGCGVPEEHLPRLFEPFFTTKRGAGGSGLGLHIVYNLATQTLGGRIAAENGAGGGAVFILRLPKIAPTADKARAGGAEANKTEEAA